MTVLLPLQLSNGISAESRGAVVLPFVSLLRGSLLSIRLSDWVVLLLSTLPHASKQLSALATHYLTISRSKVQNRDVKSESNAKRPARARSHNTEHEPS
ncbi:hypothetical protein CDV31_014748 [Fusarium ambrosium]|uniref:Uncharacterized protein n=1 Tax=Fusarium ambrosium TaxID=131363 RepID=A0A428SUH3_9HYPO|nr:hypothetical protein CDV31_014748 [Fusarium ambrosium]